MSPTGRPTTVAGYDAWLDSEMTELDHAFDLCEPLGIKLLIDLHYTPLGSNGSQGTLVFFDQSANDKIVSAWQTLATLYKGRSGLYGYDLINEPLEWSAPTSGLDYKTTMIKIGNAIRAIDRKTPIFIEALVGDAPFGFDTLTPVPLTNVVYEAHMYQPFEYTFQQLNANYPNAYTYPGTVGTTYYNKSTLTSSLADVRTFQTNYNARIYIGEFSAVRWASGAATYLRDCIDIFEGYGWSWTYHAFKEATEFSLEYQDTPKSPATPATTPTDRYNQVVGYGLNLNK